MIQYQLSFEQRTLALRLSKISDTSQHLSGFSCDYVLEHDSQQKFLLDLRDAEVMQIKILSVLIANQRSFFKQHLTIKKNAKSEANDALRSSRKQYYQCQVREVLSVREIL